MTIKRETVDFLKNWARWAREGQKYNRCGSAEGAYRAPKNDDDRQINGAYRVDVRSAIKAERLIVLLPEVEGIILVEAYIHRSGYVADRDVYVRKALRRKGFARTHEQQVLLFERAQLMVQNNLNRV
jgi:GNAT superfamily N-acetyltransferase